MVEFMADPAAVVETPVKLRGTVTSTEMVGWNKWYSIMLPGEGGYEAGLHFMVEGFEDDDYPDTMTTIEISGIFDLLEGIEAVIGRLLCDGEAGGLCQYKRSSC